MTYRESLQSVPLVGQSGVEVEGALDSEQPADPHGAPVPGSVGDELLCAQPGLVPDGVPAGAMLHVVDLGGRPQAYLLSDLVTHYAEEFFRRACHDRWLTEADRKAFTLQHQAAALADSSIVLRYFGLRLAD